MKVRKSLVKRSQANLPVWERGANPEQLQVIRWENGPLRVLAAAGSGKTRTVCCRIARMVEHCNIEPKRILATTFSKKAADEMTKRIEKDMGVSGCRVGTWHSLCLEILRKDKTRYAEWSIEDSGPGTNRRMMLKDVVGFRGMKWNGADVNSLDSFVTICKANLWSPESPEALNYAKEKFNWAASRACEAFHRLNDMAEQRGVLFFDDFLVFTIDHLRDENNRLNWAQRWDHLICDEVQDNNDAQSTIALLLAGDHQNYMVVGDIWQSIYSFRGSSPEYLANFEKYWPGTTTITLPRNYRSGHKIIEVANSIVSRAQIPGYEPMIMQAERKDSGEIKIACCESQEDEGHVVVDRIQHSVKAGDSEYSDHTVLYRMNAQSRAVEEALLKRRIPYIVVGGVSFYERKEVRDLLAYLRLAAKRAKVEDVKRSINTPFRFLGAAFVGRVMDEVDEDTIDHADWPSIVDSVANQERIQSRQRDSAHEWAGLIREVQETIAKAAAITDDDLFSPDPDHRIKSEETKRIGQPAQLLDFIVRETKYIDFLNREEGSENTENSGAANVRELIRVAERFGQAHELLDYIDETVRAAREQRKDKQAGGQRVLLMSIHRSKGLEWPFVYVIGFNEMVLPHPRNVEEEERRISYVAVTRARDTLHMSYVRRFATRAGIKDVAPSKFLLDTGLRLDGPETKESLAEIGEPQLEEVDPAVAATSSDNASEEVLENATSWPTNAIDISGERVS